MVLSHVLRNQLDYALRIGGYHNACEVEGEWVAADATFAPGRCFLAYSQAGASQVIVAGSLPHVARAFAEEGHVPHPGVALPTGAVAAFLIDVPDLHAAVRRLFELSRSLPSAPLDRFHENTHSLPTTTEVERLVVQRIGQSIFREALMDFWSGRCAVTGLDQPEMLRASHMKPWADCVSDAERLDPFNGVLLAVHWDAAFDCGLVTFADDGAVQLPANCRKRRAIFFCARRYALLASPDYGSGICHSCSIIVRKFGGHNRRDRATMFQELPTIDDVVMFRSAQIELGPA